MSEARPGDWSLWHGDGANMGHVRDEEADLILTSPPYFDQETEEWLRAPRKEQTDLEPVRERSIRFAMSLRPVFEESFRVCRGGGWLVVQTKPLRYGHWLIPVSMIHWELAEAAGFRMVSRVFWDQLFDSPRHRNPDHLRRRASRGEWQSMDVEDVMVFRRPGTLPGRDPTVELDQEELRESIMPVWRSPGPPRGGHPYASPPDLVRRLVALLTRPGDLVVDPFAGQGTVLRVATRMGRRAVGYELLEHHVSRGRKRIIQEQHDG